MRRVIVILSVVLYTAAVLAGCSGKVQNSRAAGTASERIIEPCELVSKPEAEQLTGVSLKDAEKTDTRAVGMKLCIYNAADESSARFLQISITQQAFMPDNGQTPKSIFQSLKDNFDDAVAVEGIGDEAFIAPPGLHLLKEDYYICIAVGNSDDGNNREILKAAGRVAVKNLEKLINSTGK